jgi:hypothetical protein
MKKMLIQYWFVKEVRSNFCVIKSLGICVDHVTIVDAYGRARTGGLTVSELDFYCEIRSLGMKNTIE